MNYIIQCQCGQQMTVEDQHAGHPAVCINCHQTIQIPSRPFDPLQIPIAHVSLRPSGNFDVPNSSPPSSSDPFYLGRTSAFYEPHRGTLILLFGILSITGICCCCCVTWVFGLAAIIMGASDLSEMRGGSMDSSGAGLTRVGITLAVVALGMYVVVFTIGALGFGLKDGEFPRGLPLPRLD